MPELKAMYIRQRRYMLFLLAAYILGWVFTSQQPVFLGLILGTSLSFFNLWLLVRKTEKFGNVVSKGGKMRSMGLMYRMAASIIGVMIAMEFPQYFHLISVVIGLMTAYIVIMIDSFFQIFHLHN